MLKSINDNESESRNEGSQLSEDELELSEDESGLDEDEQVPYDEEFKKALKSF